MSETYAKLFSSILRSSIWAEPLETKIVWITMLALSDRYGYVGASVPGIAQASGVPVHKAAEAIERFLSPDEWSRSKEFDGRRIEVTDRGWTILNYERFRDMRDEEARREYERDRKREQRAKQAEERDGHAAPVTECDNHGQAGTVPQSPGQMGENVDCPAMSAHAEASASASPSGEVQKKTPRADALGSTTKKPKANVVDRPDDVSEPVWDDWISHRKKRRAPVSETVLTIFRKEADLAGMTLQEAIETSVAQGWQGFRAEFVAKNGSSRGGTPKRRVADGGDWTGNSEPIQEF